MTNKKVIKSYVDEMDFEFFEAMAEFTGFSISKLIQTAVMFPYSYRELMAEFRKTDKSKEFFKK